jgi:hypothetical protein
MRTGGSWVAGRDSLSGWKTKNRGNISAQLKAAKVDGKLETVTDEASAASAAVGEGKVEVHVVPHEEPVHAEQT